jgi:hypothetical protein
VKRAWIYDTPALVGYALDTSRRVLVGLRLVADDPGFRLTVPAVCLIEAYAAMPKDRCWRLDALAVNPGVQIMGVAADQVAAIGARCVPQGRAGVAQVVFLAAQGPAIVFTDAPMPPEVETRPV